MSSLLIKNGTLVTADDSFVGDILIQDGKIAALGTNLAPHNISQTIDANNLFIFPGAIDAHVHMDLNIGKDIISSDDFYSGTRAALAGGTTTIIDFVTPQRGQSLIEALHQRQREAEKSLCDYSFHISATEWQDNTAAELKQCVVQEGITSIKLYMAYKKSIGLDDKDILQVMNHAAQLGMVVLLHCEHDETLSYLQQRFIAAGQVTPAYHPLSRPPEVEREAVIRALLMAQATGCQLYIVHVSTSEALTEITNALQTGQMVFTETCPHYLLLDDSSYDSPHFEGAKYVMSPPLRKKKAQHDLWNALKSGIIHTIATDHCPFHFKGQKEIGKQDFTLIPNGVAGVEHRLMLLYSYGVRQNRLTLSQFVKLTATQPAQIFGLYPQKGTIAVGSDADLVLWDPLIKSTISARTHYQNCDYTIYEGFSIQGKPHTVLLRGEVAFHNEQVILERGSGKYLRRTEPCHPVGV